MTSSERPGPRPFVEGEPYSVPRSSAPVDLRLDANEGQHAPRELLRQLAEASPEIIRRYPKKADLEALLAKRLDLPPARLIVTNGGDDAIDRVCRAFLGPGRHILMPEPSFEMIARYARLAKGEVRRYRWEPDGFPVQDILDAVDDETAVIVIVSPNNPTGASATADQLRAIATEADHALLLVDLAYIEFADEDLTDAVLDLPNAVGVRTLSKAWGMAGLRIGYAVGSSEVVAPLRAAGGPYPVSGPSLEIAARRLRDGEAETRRFIERVRDERARLFEHLEELGLGPHPSDGNFIFADVGDGAWLRDAMAGMGIGIRAFPGHEVLDGSVRITCPGDVEDFGRLEHALETIYRPEALVFDMDGVLADVSGSYRQAIIGTAAHFGVEVDSDDVAQAKSEGDANNDWVLTRRMLADRGVDVAFEDVKREFEARYQGDGDHEGLWRTESLLCEVEWLEDLREDHRMAIVTGRPRRDAERFLDHAGIDHLFETVVCMEDAPLKPEPDPVLEAMDRIGVERTWFVGDTPDDVVAARRAGVLPIGVVAPGDDPVRVRRVLTTSGAAFVLERVTEIEELLP